MAADIGFHLNQVWHVEVAPGQALTDKQAMGIAARAGAAAIRYDFNWRDYNKSSDISFDANAFALDETAFARYLTLRGYGEKGSTLASVYAELLEAQRLGLKTVFNLNTIPDWAKLFPQEPYQGVAAPRPRAFILADNRRVGEFLHDFIVYCARKLGGEGLSVLKSIQGFQIFNEVGGWTQQYNPGYGFYEPRQLPYDEYLQILDHAMALKQQAFRKIGFEGDVPPVLGPNLAGTHTPAFWRAVARYVPRNAETTAANGKLKLEGISLHPYGIRVRPDVDLEREEAEERGHFGVNEAASRVGDNITYNRIMQPTDDRLWLLSMIGRDPERSAAWQLYRYGERADPSREGEPAGQRGFSAELYYDVAPELGVERTLALLDSLGLATPAVHFTEFGASSYPGNEGDGGLWETNFADPYRYGFLPPGQPQDRDMAEALQTEAVAQTLGLIESWDFVKTATVYSLVEWGGKDPLDYFGLIRHRLAPSGEPDWKPAGAFLKAFLAGDAFSHHFNSENPDNAVDFILEGSGTAQQRTPDHHEVLLLRGGDDTLDCGNGDDIAFGGQGADRLAGGEGYDKLYGGFGDDTLEGGAGDDRLKGDAGNDTLTGGPGRDNFVFSAYAGFASGFSGHDTITDFDSTEDTLTLIGAGGGAGDLQARMEDTPDGVVLQWAANGATLTLQGVTLSSLTAGNFKIVK